MIFCEVVELNNTGTVYKNIKEVLKICFESLFEILCFG